MRKTVGLGVLLLALLCWNISSGEQEKPAPEQPQPAEPEPVDAGDGR